MKRWVIPAVAILVAEYVFALIIGARVGFRYDIPIKDYSITGLTVAGVGVSVGIVVRLAGYWRANESHPSRRLLSDLPRFYAFATGAVLLALQMSVLTWTKIMLPIATGFWADYALAHADHLLFGTDAWTIFSRLFGFLSPVVDWTYVSWGPIKLALMVVVLWLPESRRKSQAIIADFLILFATAVGQYALPSAGPIFYSRLGLGDRFVALPIEPWVSTARDYLWHSYVSQGSVFGGGISAMPSLHVAGALWIALVLRSVAPKVAPLGFAYFATIEIGSVLLGWHYFVDGIAACAIALLSWYLADHLSLALGKEVRAPAFARASALT